MTVKQKMIDHGWMGIVSEIKKMKGSYTKVGYPQEGKIEPNPDTGITQMSELVTVASVHEFGAPNKGIPERSYLRAAVDEGRQAILNIQKVEIKKITGGSTTVNNALKRMGEFMKNRIQQKIRRGPFVPLKPATIKAKGSSVPLIDTGQMIQSIQHVEVING